MFCPCRNSGIVVCQPLFDVLRQADVMAAFVVLNDADEIHELRNGEGRALLHGLHLVAGTGFEPVTFRL